MFIVTKNNIVKEISKTLGLDLEHRNIILDDHNLAYAPNEKYDTFEVEEVPEGVEIEKYCYTPEKGFYLNEEYKESKTALTNEELTEQITELQEALAELAEGGNL